MRPYRFYHFGNWGFSLKTVCAYSTGIKSMGMFNGSFRAGI